MRHVRLKTRVHSSQTNLWIFKSSDRETHFDAYNFQYTDTPVCFRITRLKLKGGEIKRSCHFESR